MISISNFEKQLKGASLTRGKNYYKAGAVLEIEEVEKGIWVADVKGTEVYEVNVTLKKDGTVKDCFCDCPHDDEFCKHVIAVLYWLGNEKTIAVEEKPKLKSLSINQLLKKITLDELNVFIKNYASKNKDFKLSFEIAFANKDDNYDLVKTYDELIKKVIKKHMQRGFIHYQNIKPLARELDKILIEIKLLTTEGNLMDAFQISAKLLNQAVHTVADIDDSGGYFGDFIFECISQIDHIFEKSPIDLKEKIFEFVSKELQKKIYFDYGDFGLQLFEIFFNASISLSKQEEFLGYVDAKIDKLSGTYDSYLKADLQKRKIDFLKQIGDDKQAEELTLQNLDIVEIRATEVEKLIQNKEYTNAKQLIIDGIKIAKQKAHSGTESNWEKELLRIAVLEKDVKKVREFTKKFAFESYFNVQYYKQWRSTFKTEEWTEVIEEHIKKTILKIEKDIKNRPYWFSENNAMLASLAPIYVAEGYIDRLWSLIKTAFTFDILLTYHKYIFLAHADELLTLYLRALDKEAEIASNRNSYRTLVLKMKEIAKSNATYKEAMLKKAEFLRTLYIKRPAFLNELMAIK